MGTKQENAPHSRNLASRSVPGPTGSPWSSGPCPSRTPYTWRCCPWCQARRVYPIQDANECARVHLITLIIQPLVLASPNPPPKNLQTTIHRRGGGGVAGEGGWVSSPQFSQPYFPLAAELLPCATWHGHLPCDHCQSSASSSSALIPTPDRWPTPPPLLHQTGYFYTHQHSYARWEGDQGEGWSTSGGRPKNEGGREEGGREGGSSTATSNAEWRWGSAVHVQIILRQSAHSRPSTSG